MALQNRVHPDGRLLAEPARGTLMGNRGGRFHDPVGRTLIGTRRWASRRWICCGLSFRGRHRTVWGEGYTEVFFLDEVTALAAGHRPCAECRRAAARAFQAAVSLGREALTLDEIDRILHAERRSLERAPVIVIGDLPSGAVVGDASGEAFAILEGTARPWTPRGYGPPRAPSTPLRLLTPPLSLAALRAGYRPIWHASAGSTEPLRCASPEDPSDPARRA